MKIFGIGDKIDQEVCVWFVKDETGGWCVLTDKGSYLPLKFVETMLPDTKSRDIIAKAYAISEKWKEKGKTRNELLKEFGRTLDVSLGGM